MQTAPVKGKGEKLLLDHCIGYVDAYHMVALMGPSGCGKTTLLDTLAGRKPRNLRSSGEILINGHHSKLSYGAVSYVPQDDILTGTLTVKETLTFTAALRLKKSARERSEVVREVMQQLGLLTAANTPVGTVFIKGLSGGQKRRLSIGCELIVSPSIMFLDEPTSVQRQTCERIKLPFSNVSVELLVGLDSASAFFCMQALRNIVKEGRTVFMSIHQPSAEVFDLFDQLLLLSSGRMIYFGTASGAEDFYQRCGLSCPQRRALADHYIFCLNDDFKKQKQEFEDEESVDAMEQGHKLLDLDMRTVEAIDRRSAIETLNSTFLTDLKPAIKRRLAQAKAKPGAVYAGIENKVSAASQFATLTKRMLLNSARDIGIFWLRLGMYLGLCVCLGTVYFQMGSGWQIVASRGGLIFFTVSFLTFMSVSGFPVFVDDMKVFVRERLNNYYGVAPYTLAGTVACAPFLALMSIVCSIVVYFLSGLNDDADRFFYFVLNLYVVLMVVEALMMAIAAVVPHYLLGLAAGAGIMGCFMPVAGYIIPRSEIPAPVWRYPVHYIAFHTYSINGMMLNEFEGTSGWGCPCSVLEGGCADPNCTISGDEVLEALDYGDRESKWADIGILVGMLFAYRLLFFLLLKFREARSK